METLKLVLKKRWYDMISSGEKKEEYRDITDYWGSRLTTLPGGMMLFSYRNGYSDIPVRDDYDRVTFYLGYSKGRPSMTFAIKGIRVGVGKEEWGAEPGKKYFIISLGERKE